MHFASLLINLTKYFIWYSIKYKLNITAYTCTKWGKVTFSLQHTKTGAQNVPKHLKGFNICDVGTYLNEYMKMFEFFI